MLERIISQEISIYIFISYILKRLTQMNSLIWVNHIIEEDMKQLDIFDTDYKSHNYTDTSKSAYNKQKPKLKTKREQVYDLIKLNALTNYEISDELDIPLSSCCARVRELQILNLVEDSGLRRETKYGKQAIVWKCK